MEWIEAARADDIEPDAAIRIDVGEHPVAVWNVDGEFYATADTCSHEEVSLSEGDIWDGRIECPLHGAQFDPRTGAVLSLPAVLPIPTFPCKVEEGTVYVGRTGELLSE